MGLFCLYVGDLCVKMPNVERGKKCEFTNVNYRQINRATNVLCMLVDNYIGVACGKFIRFDTLLRTNFKFNQNAIIIFYFKWYLYRYCSRLNEWRITKPR